MHDGVWDYWPFWPHQSRAELHFKHIICCSLLDDDTTVMARVVMKPSGMSCYSVTSPTKLFKIPDINGISLSLAFSPRYLSVSPTCHRKPENHAGSRPNSNRALLYQPKWPQVHRSTKPTEIWGLYNNFPVISLLQWWIKNTATKKKKKIQKRAKSHYKFCSQEWKLQNFS